MSHRPTTWWRALSVVLLSLATVAWPSAARADTTPRFTLVHQNALTTLSAQGTSHFVTTVRLSPLNVLASADVTLYPSLVARSQLTPIVSGAGTSAKPLSSTGKFDLRCLRNGVATFSVSLFTHAPSSSSTCSGVTPRLRLPCASRICDGVYPLRFVVTVNGVSLTKWSLIAVQRNYVARPISVALVEMLTPSALKHPRRSLGVLNTIGHFDAAPLTLGVDYEALAAMELSPTQSTSWRKALDQALLSSLHRVVVAPPSAIDFAGLVANGLTTQVPQQLTLSQNLVTSLTGRQADAAVVLSGAQSRANLLALAGAGVRNVVLPEGDLSEAPSSTLTWGAPFHVEGTGTLNALSSDAPLADLVSSPNIEPGRRAALTLATLAFLHFEAPYAPANRTVVVEAPVGSTSKAFVSDLLSGLRHDPFDRLTTLAPSFNSSLIATNGAPSVRTLAASTASTWSAHNVSSLLTLIGAVNSYSRGIQSGNVGTELRVAVARSEILASANQRQNAINAANDLLNAQLTQFSIDASAVTLAGQGTSLPVTVHSRAPYRVGAVLHLVTDGLTFPKGAAIPITLSSLTQSIRVPTADPRGSSLTLQIVLTTPNGQVVLARSAVQVRIAGTSVVGYLLTFASLFVLGLWWWRTHRRRPKARHAR
jgi:hypothetical protein